MRAKMTRKNQITLPETVLASLGATKYFDVATEGERIVLTPVHINPADANPADAVREKLDALGITEHDVIDAVAWARQERG